MGKTQMDFMNRVDEKKKNLFKRDKDQTSYPNA